MNGKVSKAIDIYEHYSGLFEQLENNAGQTILGIVGVRTMWQDCSSSVITTSLRGLPII